MAKHMDWRQAELRLSAEVDTWAAGLFEQHPVVPVRDAKIIQDALAGSSLDFRLKESYPNEKG